MNFISWKSKNNSFAAWMSNTFKYFYWQSSVLDVCPAVIINYAPKQHFAVVIEANLYEINKSSRQKCVMCFVDILRFVGVYINICKSFSITEKTDSTHVLKTIMWHAKKKKKTNRNWLNWIKLPFVIATELRRALFCLAKWHEKP